MDSTAQTRIVNWLKTNLDGCENPRLHGKTLTGKWHGHWRYRVGEYRIIAQIRDDKLVILVVRIDNRGGVYDGGDFMEQNFYTSAAVEEIFMPFLHELTALRMTLDRKVIAYLVGAPGSGKSTLANFLEQLSRERKNEIEPIRALPMDGYHFSAAYMDITTVERDGEQVLMRDIKGAPETFDVELLVDKIREVRQEGTNWNIYDRKIHDVLPDYWNVEDEILLIEGNYLLLKDHGWTTVRTLADYSVFLDVPREILRPRLINRKIQGGLSPEAAEKFFEFSDSRNIERVLNNSATADEIWSFSHGEFIRT